jgi:PAS domain S-box-containing protein
MTSDSTASEAVLSENASLRQRVSELERQLRDQQWHEAALSASARVLQSIVDSIPYAIYWKDTDLIYCGCNQHFAADLGLASTKAIIGKSDEELPWRPEEVEGFRAIDRRVIETNTPEHDTDETTVHADGKQEWFETHKVPLHDQDGSVVGVLGTYANITERRRAEEAIRQSAIQVANALIRTAQAAQLLGARVILTGITPEVAQTLVQLGIELSSVTTRSTFQSGIAYALARR